MRALGGEEEEEKEEEEEEEEFSQFSVCLSVCSICSLFQHSRTQVCVCTTNKKISCTYSIACKSVNFTGNRGTCSL